MKNWLVEVGVKTFGPSAVRGAVLGIAGWLMAKEGMLAPFGIVSDAVAKTTTIYWEQLSAAIILGLPALIAGIVKLTQREGEKVVTKVTQPKPEGTPQ
jgi:hypothetical protein